jgi:hypothetical protein
MNRIYEEIGSYVGTDNPTGRDTFKRNDVRLAFVGSNKVSPRIVIHRLDKSAVYVDDGSLHGIALNDIASFSLPSDPGGDLTWSQRTPILTVKEKPGTSELVQQN